MLSKHFSEAIFSSVVKKLVSKDGTKFPDVDRVPSGDRPSTFIHELSSRPNLGRPFICFIRKFNDWKFTCRARILTTLTHLTAWRNLIQQNHTQRAALIFAYSFHRTQHQFSFQSPFHFPIYLVGGENAADVSQLSLAGKTREWMAAAECTRRAGQYATRHTSAVCNNTVLRMCICIKIRVCECICLIWRRIKQSMPGITGVMANTVMSSLMMI